jgi:raffinose/stachyose/melibiose transport system substrate-binding protein
MSWMSRFRRSKLLGAVAVFAVVAAAAGVSTALSFSSKGGDNVTLSLVGVAAPISPATSAVIKAYERLHPNVTIKATYVPGDTYTTAVAAQIRGGNVPDLIEVFPGGGSSNSVWELAKAHVIRPLSGQPWAKTIPTSFHPAAQYKGQTYIFPLSFSMIGVIYNKQVFAKYHVAIPTTYSKLLSLCDTLNGDGVAPIALALATPWNTQLPSYALVASLVYAKDPKFAAHMAAGKATFAKSNWRAAFNAYIEMAKRGCFNKGFTGTEYTASLRMLAEGKAAMAIQVTESLPALKADSPKGQFGMFPFPGTNGPQSSIWIPVGANDGFGISTHTKHLKEAEDFVSWLNRPQNAKKFADALGDPPITAGVPQLPSNLKLMQQKLAKAETTTYMDQFWPNSELQPTHFTVVQQLLTNQISVSQALAKMDQAYRKH